jgi:hypothetical protein
MQGKGEQKDAPNQPPQPRRDKSHDPDELQKQPEPEQQDVARKDDPKDPKSAKPKGDPKHGDPDPSHPEQANAERPPPKGATGEFQRTDLAGRWGVLPPKEAEELQRRDAEEFPERYRRWMELYFNRVNRLQGRDR